jgi:hypothetical protein
MRLKTGEHNVRPCKQVRYRGCNIGETLRIHNRRLLRPNDAPDLVATPATKSEVEPVWQALLDVTVWRSRPWRWRLAASIVVKRLKPLISLSGRMAPSVGPYGTIGRHPGFTSVAFTSSPAGVGRQ